MDNKEKKEKRFEEKEKPAHFAVELGKLKLTDSQVGDIQNAISKAVAERVIALGIGVEDTWGSFNRWDSFGQSGGGGIRQLQDKV